MPPTNLSEQVYRGVIALNNYGVALLEGRCYWQALATMRDAMEAMRISFRRTSFHRVIGEIDVSDANITDDALPEDNSQLELIQSYTHQACLHFANPQRHHSDSIAATNIYVSTFSTSDYDRPSASLDQSNDETSLVSPSESITIYPIHCDDLDSECCNDVALLEMNAAILLHNCGLVHWCMYKTTETHLHSRVAAELLILSQKIMDRLTHRSRNELFLMERRVICLAFTVVRSLLLVLRDPRQVLMSEREISELQRRLRTLQNALQRTWEGSRFITAAAA